MADRMTCSQSKSHQQDNVAYLPSPPTHQDGKGCSGGKGRCGGSRGRGGRAEDHGRGWERGADPAAVTYLETLFQYEWQKVDYNKLRQTQKKEFTKKKTINKRTLMRKVTLAIWNWMSKKYQKIPYQQDRKERMLHTMRPKNRKGRRANTTLWWKTMEKGTMEHSTEGRQEP